MVFDAVSLVPVAGCSCTLAVHLVMQVANVSASFVPLPIMKLQKLANGDAYLATGGPRKSRAFETLSRILVALIAAALMFFCLLMTPAALSPFIDELLGWCIAGVVGLVIFIAVLGAVEWLMD